ncbi:uncharacterized protein [Chelonus insularis]|uniref:uncharacterized protein n=1 Tax=Chelonus insularis TaxID=460826 RepID=UPI00158C943E|nr:uncharacterized protein LOC118073379 [Chelonus insularis]
MDFDANLLTNFIPITATFSALVIALIIVVRGIKKRWPITVNCWFCNSYTKVYRSEIDWWLCPSCEQYNGFSKDGDYKYDIPEQRSKKLNNSLKPYLSPYKNELSKKRKNGLCKNCNNNEELKLIELRSVDPKRWRDTEIESFKQNLDKKYPLCKKCNSFVRKVLHKQSLWLTQYKMLFYKQKPLKIIMTNISKFEKLCRLFLTLLSSSLIYYPTYQSLSTIGALLQLIIMIKASSSRRNMDLFSLLLWITVGVIMPHSDERLIKLKLKFLSIILEHITGYQIIIFLSVILGFMNIPSTNFTVTNTNVSFKKLETLISSPNLTPTISRQITPTNNKRNSDVQSTRPSPVDVTHLLTSSPLDSTPVLKPTPMLPNFRICDSQRSFSSNLPTHKQTQLDIFTKRSPVQKHTERYTLNDSLKSLNNLSLNTNNQKQASKNVKVFATRTYGTSSPDLFQKSYKSSHKDCILAPPKLKSVTQTSWVAGGYWQMGMDPPTLSRSSSQSSGFGSTGSNFGPSREPSIVNDVDKCSVVSDGVPCYNQPLQRHTSLNPIGSFCQRGSTYRLPECTGCIRSPSANMMITSCHPSHQASFCHNYHISDQYVQNHTMNIIPRNADLSTCISHSPSILTSPNWLPALLCGSIVFNMIVFCTILLR